MQKYVVVLLSVALVLMAGCSTRVPIAETPHRAPLMATIVDKSSMARVITKVNHQPKTEEELRQEAHSSIDKRKALIKVELPDEYWAAHERNIYLFLAEMNTTSQRALELYKARYKETLAFATDEQLEQLAGSADMESTPAFKNLFEGKDAQLTVYYFLQSNRQTAIALDQHLSRMKAMDRRYNACAVVDDCWK